MKKFGFTLLTSAFLATAINAQEAPKTEEVVEEKSNHSFSVNLDSYFSGAEFGAAFDNEEGTRGFGLETVYSYKLNEEGYALVLYFGGSLEESAAGQSMKWAHGGTFAQLSSPKVFEIAGFDGKYALRYGIPTDSTSQNAGQYGYVMFRPEISKQITDWYKLKIRTRLYAFLNRDGYGRDGTTGNALAAFRAEFLNSFTLAGNLSFDLALTPNFVWMNRDKGIGGTTEANSHRLIAGVNYHLPGMENLVYTLEYYNKSGFGAGSDLEFFKSAESTYTFRVAYSF